MLSAMACNVPGSTERRSTRSIMPAIPHMQALSLADLGSVSCQIIHSSAASL
jgi:hypothetical protein